MCRTASGANLYKNFMRHSARGLSIVEMSRGNCIMMTPLCIVIVP